MTQTNNSICAATLHETSKHLQYLVYLKYIVHTKSEAQLLEIKP